MDFFLPFSTSFLVDILWCALRLHVPHEESCVTNERDKEMKINQIDCLIINRVLKTVALMATKSPLIMRQFRVPAFCYGSSCSKYIDGVIQTNIYLTLILLQLITLRTVILFIIAWLRLWLNKDGKFKNIFLKIKTCFYSRKYFWIYRLCLTTILIKTWLLIDYGDNPLINSLRPSDAYMRQQFNHHWSR